MGSKEITFKALCQEKGVVYSNALYQRKKHPSLTDLEVIECCLKPKESLTKEEKEKYYKDKKKPFRVLCTEKGVDFSRAYMFKSRHPKMTDDEIIAYYVNKPLKKLCTKNKVSFIKALQLKLKDDTLEDDVIVSMLLKEKKNTNIMEETFVEDLETVLE